MFRFRLIQWIASLAAILLLFACDGKPKRCNQRRPDHIRQTPPPYLAWSPKLFCWSPDDAHLLVTTNHRTWVLYLP